MPARSGNGDSQIIDIFGSPASPDSISAVQELFLLRRRPQWTINVNDGIGNCRQRKIKCDRTLPDCNLCSRADIACIYDGSRKRPGLRAGYVQQLKKRIAILENEFRDFKQRLPDRQEVAATGTVIAPVSGNADSEIASTMEVDDISNSRDEMIITTACKIWFDQYHSWLPILHRPSILTLMMSMSQVSLEEQPIVLKAILATVDASLFPQGVLDTGKHQQFQTQLCNAITLEALSTPACSSLQALLILSVNSFGDGDMYKFWNLISLSKRISMQLGLPDLVVHYCSNYGTTSALPPRMLLVPSSDIELEERVRAYWVTEVLDSASTIGSSWNSQLAPPEVGPLSPYDDDPDWSSDPNFVRIFPSGSTQTPSSFAVYVRLISTQIWECHKHHQKICDLTDPQLYEQQKIECQALDEKLTSWHEEFHAIAVTTTPVRVEGTNVNAALGYCLIDMTVVTLYQRMIRPPPRTKDQTPLDWAYGRDRCLAACDHIANALRELPDAALDCTSPQFIVCIFVAARFYIVDSQMLQRPLSPKMHVLKYALSCCAGMWNLARRLDKVLVAAERSHGQTGNDMELLPTQFWDLQYSWQDIDHALQQWAEGKH
ncbi:hypothetical protein E4T47_06951 [Aureobasidium subglaciale]|nr:hypothetical protein E4T47_06951 [Aureobasidium subglaciale]